MRGHVIVGSTFVLVLMAIARTANGQCTLSLTFPLEEMSRTIRITRTTTSVTVRVNLQCTGVSLPTENIATTITFADPNNVVTSNNPVMVTIFTGSTSAETSISLMVTSGMPVTQVLTVTLTTSATVASVNTSLDQLVFSLEDIAEISFDTTKTYQGQLGDTISVCLIRTGAQPQITFNVVALGGSSLLNTPVEGTFAANSDTTSVDIMILGDGPTDTDVTLVINSIPDTVIVTRNLSQRATFAILREVILSTATSASRLSAISSFVEFRVTASRSYTSDITINLSYTGDFTILENQPSTITLTSGTTVVSENIMINPTSSHTFTITMLSADNGVTISETQSFTTYTIDALNIVISVSQTVYTAAEGTTITVTFTTNEPAPTEIEIDVFTPDASHASQLGPLANAVISAGASRGAIGIQIQQDFISEGTQVVMVSFSSLTNGADIASGDETITINILDTTDSTGDDPIINLPDATTNNNGNGLSGGAVAGIAVGAVSFLILILGMAICCGLFVMSNRHGPASPYGIAPYPVLEYVRQRRSTYSTPAMKHVPAGYPGRYPGGYPAYSSGPIIYEVEY